MSNDEAKEDRRRIFGMLSLENAISLLVVIVAFTLGYGALSADVKVNTRDIQNGKMERDIIAKQAVDMRADSAAMMASLTLMRAEVSALQAGKDANQRLLMDMNSKIEVLLDRTDPKKPRTP